MSEILSNQLLAIRFCISHGHMHVISANRILTPPPIVAVVMIIADWRKMPSNVVSSSFRFGRVFPRVSSTLTHMMISSCPSIFLRSRLITNSGSSIIMFGMHGMPLWKVELEIGWLDHWDVGKGTTMVGMVLAPHAICMLVQVTHPHASAGPIRMLRIVGICWWPHFPSSALLCAISITSLVMSQIRAIFLKIKGALIPPSVALTILIFRSIDWRMILANSVGDA